MANPILRQGSRGSDVTKIQVTLNNFAQDFKRPDFRAGTADGIFGAGTARAVKSFQASVNLTPDGIVGPSTWAAINTVGQALMENRDIGLKPPQKAPAGQTPGAAPKPLPPPGGFDLASLTGDVDWKVVGIAIAVGIGILYTMRGR